MAEEIKKITKRFNETVKKGSLFQMNYYSNEEDWQTFEVISGKATVVKDVLGKEKRADGRDNKKVFRADEADQNGNIEIAVTGHHRNDSDDPKIYKIHVV